MQMTLDEIKLAYADVQLTNVKLTQVLRAREQQIQLLQEALAAAEALVKEQKAEE